MRRSDCLYPLMVIMFVFSGCVSSHSTLIPMWTETPLPSSTSISPTFTPTFTPTEAVTPTPLVTLEPEQAKETIKTLLQEPVDCSAPCFWGIVPGHTTLGEANNIFARLTLPLKYTNTLESKEFYESTYQSDSDLSVSPLLAVQDNIVKSLTIYITPETQLKGVRREWSAYSPETLINRYGLPSKIDFFVGRAAPSPSYAIVIYYDALDLIIQYYSYDLGANLQVCPVSDQMDSIRIWMGKEPQYPPLEGVSLEKAAAMTLEELSNLMTGDPTKACFNLKEEMFP